MIHFGTLEIVREHIAEPGHVRLRPVIDSRTLCGVMFDMKSDVAQMLGKQSAHAHKVTCASCLRIERSRRETLVPPASADIFPES